MEIHGFHGEGGWYKGNLHCHTTVSDGKLSPKEVVDLYKSHGYHFLAISDHNIFTDFRNELNSEAFIVLPAVEASAILLENKDSYISLKTHHIHGLLGTSELQEDALEVYEHMDAIPVRKKVKKWNGAKEAQDLSDELRKHGCVTIYNHPIWSKVRESEFVDTEGITALEIYNFGTVNESGTGYDTTFWDVMLREGKKVWAIASDDNHNTEYVLDSGGGYIVVKAEALSHEAIMQSIIDGNYYSSSGPEIYDWGVRDGVAYVTCSPVERVNFIAGNFVGAGATVISEPEETMDYALFRLSGKESYVRVECVDIYGRIAWSNPIFL